VYPGIRAKVENVHQYHEYLAELKSQREEMGVILKEDLFPSSMGWGAHEPGGGSLEKQCTGGAH